MLENLPNPPSYTAVRAVMGQLVTKGALRYRRDGKRYLYRPATPKDKASRSAPKNLLTTFFGVQPIDAMAALLDVSAEQRLGHDREGERHHLAVHVDHRAVAPAVAHARRVSGDRVDIGRDAVRVKRRLHEPALPPVQVAYLQDLNVTMRLQRRVLPFDDIADMSLAHDAVRLLDGDTAHE